MEVYISFYNCHFFFADENEIGTIFPTDDPSDTDSRSECKIIDDDAGDDNDEEEDDWEDDDENEDEENDEPETDRLKRKLFGFLNGRNHCCTS